MPLPPGDPRAGAHWASCRSEAGPPAIFENRFHARSQEEVMSDDRSDKKLDSSQTPDNIRITRRSLLGSTSLLAASAVASAALPRTAEAATPEVLPPPE